MKYGQIIRQAWQIIKHTRILWVLGLINFLVPFIKFGKTNNLALTCIIGIVSLIPLFFYVFSPYAIITSAEKVIQGETPSLKETWIEFKSILGRLILYILASIVPVGFVLICSFILLRLIFLVLHISMAYWTWNITLVALLGGPYLMGIFSFGYYGLVIHKMGVLKSISMASVLSIPTF
jgi:hypothetical protein